jgi:hypothetical protein
MPGIASGASPDARFGCLAFTDDNEATVLTASGPEAKEGADICEQSQGRYSSLGIAGIFTLVRRARAA